MDFDDSPDEAAFRLEARAWLEQHAKLRPDGRRTAPNDAAAEAAHVRACKEWQATLYEGGWAGITWPKEYGGRGGTAMQQVIFNQEQARFDVTAGAFTVAIGMVGPTLIAHGTPEQRARYLEPMLRGEELWCQLFSEPGAGSDLAGLGTRAVADGSGVWVVNGQKVWTSGAHFSDFGILLARTDVDQPKHRGITFFLLDMRTPGIEVRPLRQIDGAGHFNEVFLTDVPIPA
ncbi:MAG TPA: acyl-CoA dehydrogenase family protein, partial [Acidimicrobiales bacterium]|nr:acyl-CoA dehydrogenase family protein [Acidimicrobiales bacterium]